MEQHFTINQVAEKLSVSHKTIRKLIGNGQIEAYRVGAAIRIPQAAVDRYLDLHKIKKPLPIKPAAAFSNRRRVRGFKFL